MISTNKKYLTLSDKNRLREWRLPPIRGDFLDYFGNIIAGNLNSKNKEIEQLSIKLKNSKFYNINFLFIRKSFYPPFFDTFKDFYFLLLEKKKFSLPKMSR